MICVSATTRWDDLGAGLSDGPLCRRQWVLFSTVTCYIEVFCEPFFLKHDEHEDWRCSCVVRVSADELRIDLPQELGVTTHPLPHHGCVFSSVRRDWDCLAFHSREQRGGGWVLVPGNGRLGTGGCWGRSWLQSCGPRERLLGLTDCPWLQRGMTATASVAMLRGFGSSFHFFLRKKHIFQENILLIAFNIELNKLPIKFQI